tara:strand:+ start:1685 stop:1909 length:225 start_codon:yes stop_codon:yes gene_type:complete
MRIVRDFFRRSRSGACGAPFAADGQRIEQAGQRAISGVPPASDAHHLSGVGAAPAILLCRGAGTAALPAIQGHD